jgi:transcription termination factor NusB
MDLTYVIPIFIWASEMLFFSEEIPAKVSINEAIILTKKFWTDTWKNIVNWVLNNVYKNYDDLKKQLENINKTWDFKFFKN